MISERVGDLTLKELKTMINSAVDERFRIWSPRRDRPVIEVLESMRKNVWTPPPGAKSSLEMLREDRGR